MKRGNLIEMDPGEFLSLANRCGVELEELDLAQLARRKLVAPWQRADGDSRYTVFHLYVVSEYLRAVSPARHPWATRSPEMTVGEIAALNEKVNDVLSLATADDDDDDEIDVDELLIGVERFLARIDPFGPLGDVFDLARPRVLSEMRNDGRFYLELKRGVAALSLGLTDGASAQDHEPKTMPMFGVDEDTLGNDDDLRSTQVIGEENRETSEVAKRAIDEVVAAASATGPTSADLEVEDEIPTQVLETKPDSVREAEDDRPTQVIEVPSEAELDAEDDRPTQVLEAPPKSEYDIDLGEESSEPIVLLEEEADGDDDDSDERFKRNSAVTERTRDLKHRLQNLGKPGKAESVEAKEVEKSHEKQEANSESDVDQKKGPAMPPPSPAERIADLNRRRETYMKEQAWGKLVELYEDGIELFAEPEERQQVFLVLATLYEVKLREKNKAFGAFARAWAEQEATAGKEKALQGVQRLGKSSGLHKRYMTWLEEQLATSLEHSEMVRLQKELALGLFADEQYDLAFLRYASFLTENPDRNITEDTLTQLALFGEHVDSSEVEGVFEDLQDQDLKEATRVLIDDFAPAVGA